MSITGSRVKQTQNFNDLKNKYTYIPIDAQSNQNYQSHNIFSNYSINNNNNHSGISYNNTQRLTSNQVSQITGQKIRQGSVIKGRSRIQYVPYQKKVVDYQTRTYVERVPKTRKVIEYQQKKVYQTVPRQVIRQQFMAVQKITQYVKQIIPQKKIQIVPVSRKVKKIQYVPVQKQIVHYPQSQDFRNIQGKSRVILQSQGFQVKPDAQYRPIQSDLIYKYTNKTSNPNLPIGYVDLGQRRFLSTAPTYSSNNLSYSNVQAISNTNLQQQYPKSGLIQPFQKIQNMQFGHDGASKSFINNLNASELNINSTNNYNYNSNNSNYNNNYNYNKAQQYQNNYQKYQQSGHNDNTGRTPRSMNGY